LQIDRILFYGSESKIGIKDDNKPATVDLETTYVMHQWEVGDRVRYRWEKGQKWYEGQILHVNWEGEEATYLIKDDIGWHKNDIRLSNTKEPHHHRKPRRLRASCPELSLRPIAEDLGEEEFSSGKEESPSMRDDVEETKCNSSTTNSSPKESRHESPKSNAPNHTRKISPKLDDKRSEVVNHPSSKLDLTLNDFPKKRVIISRSTPKISSPKKNNPTAEATVTITRTSSKAPSSKGKTKRATPTHTKEHTLLAINFKKKRINGI